MVIATSVAVSVLAASCAETPPPSQAEYAASADRVCESVEERIEELEEEQEDRIEERQRTGRPSAYADRPERWLRARIVPQYESMSNQLKGLTAPDGDHAYLRDLYADLDRLIEHLNVRPSEGRSLIRLDERLRDRFASYGMHVCGTV